MKEKLNPKKYVAIVLLGQVEEGASIDDMKDEFENCAPTLHFPGDQKEGKREVRKLMNKIGEEVAADTVIAFPQRAPKKCDFAKFRGLHLAVVPPDFKFPIITFSGFFTFLLV